MAATDNAGTSTLLLLLSVSLPLPRLDNIVVHAGILRFFFSWLVGFLSLLSPFAVAPINLIHSSCGARARLQCRFTARFISEVTDASSKFYVPGIVTLEIKRAQQGHTYLYVRVVCVCDTYTCTCMYVTCVCALVRVHAPYAS